MSKEAKVLQRPALLGGRPIKTSPFPSWPTIGQEEEKGLLEVLNSGKWERHSGSKVTECEQRFAELSKAKRALMVANGSAALDIAMTVLGIGAGDEVLVSPYTFMSTISSVLLVNALPIFVDIDPDTYCIDHCLLKEHITPRTKAIIPVHFAGLPCDMEAINAVAEENDLFVIEDACQAHLAEWNGQPVGTLGDLGCFSFQISKNISGGEGGAIVSADEGLIDRCFHFHTCGRLRAGMWYHHPFPGTNLRMTEFQAAILLGQMGRYHEQREKRQRNAQYLTEKLSDIEGITPLLIPDYVTSHAYHLYVFRYSADAFGSLPRETFIKALTAEGIPCAKGYVPIYREEFLERTLRLRKFEQILGANRFEEYLDYLSGVECPVNERACGQEAVWLPQNVLLGEIDDMNAIVTAIRKIGEYSGQLAESYPGNT